MVKVDNILLRNEIRMGYRRIRRYLLKEREKWASMD
jgi:hypothetical protein